MKKRLGKKLTSALLVLAALAPWTAVPFFPEDAFAQTTVSTPTGSPLSNQAARQGGSVSFSQAAASGAVSIGACLAAGGISLGAAIGSALAALGLSSAVVAGGAAAGGAGAGAGAVGVGVAAALGLPVPVIDGVTNAELATLNVTTAAILAAQSATLVQVSAMQNKESVLDCVAWALAKLIWRSIAASIIDWINSGFNGSPTFVQDFGRFFKNVADEAIGQIIESDQYLSFLCSPFQLNIRLALAMRFARRAPSCTLSQIIDNVEAFANNFQNGGGWPAWLQYFTVPNNNPYGGYIVSEATVSFYYQNKLGQQKFELSLTSGFLNQKEKVCSQYPKRGGGTEERCREITVTPGELIAQKAAQVIGSGETQLLLADEFNEIIDALVAQLLGKALNSLTGLSQPQSYQNSFYGNGYASYTGELGGTDNPAYGGDDGTLLNQISAAIDQERAYQRLNERGLSSISAGQQQYSQAAICWQGKAGSFATSTSSTLLTATPAAGPAPLSVRFGVTASASSIAFDTIRYGDSSSDAPITYSCLASTTSCPAGSHSYAFPGVYSAELLRSSTAMCQDTVTGQISSCAGPGVRVGSANIIVSAPGGGEGLSTEQRQQAATETRSALTAMQLLESREASFAAEAAQADINIANLGELLDRAARASTQAELDSVLRDFNGTRSLPQYVQPIDVLTVNAALTALDNDLITHDAQADASTLRCQYFPDTPPAS